MPSSGERSAHDGSGYRVVVTGPGVRVAAYRHRATFGRRWGGYLSLILLVGLVGALPGRMAARTPTALLLRAE